MGRNYQKLRFYQLAYELTLDIYKLTEKLPSIERGHLVNQMRRAAASMPLNIAEGSTRPSAKDYLYFLVSALGSGKELEVCLSLCRDLNYINDEEYQSLSKKLDKTNAGLYVYMREIEKKRTTYWFFQKYDEERNNKFEKINKAIKEYLDKEEVKK